MSLVSEAVLSNTAQAVDHEAGRAYRRHLIGRIVIYALLSVFALIYLVPPIAALQAAAVFGEELTVPMILGTAIVVVGVYLTNRKDVAPAE